VALVRRVRQGTGKALTIRFSVHRFDENHKQVFEKGLSAPWPWSEAQTLPGLFLKLMYEMDQWLTEQEASAARDAASRFRQN